MKKAILLPAAAAILAGGAIAMATMSPGNDLLDRVRPLSGLSPEQLAPSAPASASLRKAPEARDGENVVTIDLWNSGTRYLQGESVSGDDPFSWTSDGQGMELMVYEMNMEWKTVAGANHIYRAKVSSDVATSVSGWLGYLNESDGYIYQVNAGSAVSLTADNGYSATIEVSTDAYPSSGLSIVLVLGANTSGAVITASESSLTCSYSALPAQAYTDDAPEGLGYRTGFGSSFLTATTSDGLTTYGLYRNGSEAYICGINTTAEALTVPANIAVDGELIAVKQLGYSSYDCDFSCAQNLRTLTLGASFTYIRTDFASSTLTDVYVENPTISIQKYCNKSDIYFHIPYGASRSRYTSYGYARVLVGEETPDYPVSDYADYVIAGDEEGTYFGIKDAGSRLAVMEVFSDAESVALPAITPYSDGYYYVRQTGYDSNYNSGTFTAHAPNLKAVTVPETYSYININWSSNSLTDLYMEGAPTDTYWMLTSRINVHIASQPLYAQYESNSNWSGAVLTPEGWDFEWLTVNVGRLGEFAQTYIELTDGDWSYGTLVKVTGKLNQTDLNNMRNLTNLRKLDLSEAEFDGLPTQWMSSNSTLQEVTLPDALHYISENAFYYCRKLVKVIGRGITVLDGYAFYNCSSLTDFDLSNMDWIKEYAFSGCSSFKAEGLNPDVRYIGQYAFRNTAIASVELNDGITAVGAGVFYGCSKLTSASLPSTVRSIAESAFYNCSKLTEVNVPAAVTSIGSSAFYNCSSLESIELPATLESIGSGMFGGCSALTEIKSKAVTPPSVSSSFLSGVNLTRCSLFVPPFVIDEYRATQYWQDFYIIKALMEPVEQIMISRPMTFNLLSEDNAVLAGNPDMTLTYGSDRNSYTTLVGQLTAEGDGTLSAGKFTIYHSFERRDYGDDYRTSLVNNADNMRADIVETSISFEKDTWHFFSLQYDVMMEDVYGLNDTDFVIREYNSERRATGDGSASNWDDVAADGILKGGRGYIIMAANNNNSGSRLAVVRFPSRNTTSKNNVFTSSNVIVPLEEHVAEFAHNRSWNLVGNPYPCYYRLNTLMDDFMTPVVIWRGSSYQAYSPVDDDVILRPCEAFFVQRPLDAEAMTFSAEGRMHYSEAISGSNGTPGARVAARPVADGRRVFNFNVEGQGSSDRTRIVLNEEARAGYDSSRDAAKFFAETSAGIEIFVTADTRYDICERPEGDGTALLGIRTAAEGEYTISLSGRGHEQTAVILTDLLTGMSVDLSTQDYTFTAEAGEDDGRFQIRFADASTVGIEGIAAEADTAVKVYSLSGILLHEGRLADFDAPKGVYIVAGNGRTFKINK